MRAALLQITSSDEPSENLRLVCEMLDEARTESLTNTVVMFKPYLPKNLASEIERALA